MDGVRLDKSMSWEVVEAAKLFHQIVRYNRSFLVAFVVIKFIFVVLMTTQWQACNVGNSIFYEGLIPRCDDIMKKSEL